LPKILVAVSYTRANKAEKDTKTDEPREVPMHPTLQRVLKEWGDVGFAEFFGREPKPDDLVVPNQWGGYRTDNTFLQGLARDLELLGVRKRRFHDFRRTFISLGRTDGANPDVLRSVTHQADGDQFDQYTTFSFETKCEAVMRLNITGRAVKAARLASGGNSPATRTATREGNAMATTQNDSRKKHGQGGTRSLLTPARGDSGSLVPQVYETTKGTKSHVRGVPCSNVATEAIATELSAALDDWKRRADRKRLAARLRTILTRVR
ncbi:MAG: hypothetical protein JNM17_04005, partial [Archangium sp.]|nr:hypothetical protein [Archangium sp.]